MPIIDPIFEELIEAAEDLISNYGNHEGKCDNHHASGGCSKHLNTFTMKKKLGKLVREIIYAANR